MIAKSAVKLSCTLTTLNGRPFVCNDSIVVLNVKEEARVGQKTASAHYASMSSIDSINDDGLNCC